METSKRNRVYVVPYFEKDSTDKILIKIRENVAELSPEHQGTFPFTIIGGHCQPAENETVFQTLAHCFIKLYRMYGLMKNERETVLTPSDQLIALQLCLAEKNKEDVGEFDVEVSTVIEAHNTLMNRTVGVDSGDDMNTVIAHYHEFLAYSNHTDFYGIYSSVMKEAECNDELKNEIHDGGDCVIFGVPEDKMEQAMLKYLCDARDVVEVVSDSGEGELDEVCVSFVTSTKDRVINTTVVTGMTQSPMSATECCVQHIMMSYLQLLVNSRSQLALARTINTPNRDIDHQAFTELRRMAKEKKLPMYQVATSYVMKVRLGGRGYAPDADCPLAAHIKGLGEFTDVMHKLQTIIEEEPNIASACKRVLNTIKNVIIKCKDNRIRPASVESVTKRLQERTADIITDAETTSFKSPDKPANCGGSLIGRKTLRIIRSLLDHTSTSPYREGYLDVLCDVFTSQKTPIRIPSLLSQFRSPIECSPDDVCSKSLAERLLNSSISARTPIQNKRYKSHLDWAHPDNLQPGKADVICEQRTVIVQTSKTLVDASCNDAKSNVGPTTRKPSETINDQENAPRQPSPKAKECGMAEKKQAPKRQLSNAEQPANKKTKVQQPKKTCRRKLLPQVQGQQSLAKFFRM